MGLAKKVYRLVKKKVRLVRCLRILVILFLLHRLEDQLGFNSTIS